MEERPTLNRRDRDVFEIGEDYVLGRVMDEFDVERVQLWPLERG